MERHNPINWENVVHNLNYIKNVLIHFSGSIDYLCNNKLMGHNLDLNEKQFDLNLEMLCLTIKEVGSEELGGTKNGGTKKLRKNKFDIVGSIEIYDDAGNFINSFSMEEIKKNYREYRDNITNYNLSKLKTNKTMTRHESLFAEIIYDLSYLAGLDKLHFNFIEDGRRELFCMIKDWAMEFDVKYPMPRNVVCDFSELYGIDYITALDKFYIEKRNEYMREYHNITDKWILNKMFENKC